MSAPTTTRVVDVEVLRDRTRQDAASLTHASASEVVRWAVEVTGTNLVVASSMQDIVLAHLVSRELPGVDVLFLDTGYHFDQTLRTRDRAAGRLPIRVVDVTARQSVAEQDAEYGPRLHDRDPELCCFLRKVEPLARSLAGYAAWVTGLRRADGPTRADAPTVGWDDQHDLLKVNPLADWTDRDVERYQRQHDLVRHPLVAQGYPSIGCAPCTRQVAPGEDARAGRWSGTGKMECGIHS